MCIRDSIYTTNLLLDLFHEDSYEDLPVETDSLDLEEILKNLLDEAVKRELIEDSVVYRDLFDTRLMNCLLPVPARSTPPSGRNTAPLPRKPLPTTINSARTATISAATG